MKKHIEWSYPTSESASYLMVRAPKSGEVIALDVASKCATQWLAYNERDLPLEDYAYDNQIDEAEFSAMLAWPVLRDA